MNVLQICHKPPYPDTDGGTMAMYGIIRGMVERGHSVDVITITTPKHPQREITDPVLKEVFIKYVFVDTRIKKRKAVRGLFDKHSYHLTRFFNPEVKNALVERFQRKKYDIVIFESLFTALYLPIVRTHSDAKCIYREHNIESRLWWQRAKYESGLRNTFLKNYNKKLDRFEFSVINDFDGIACISTDDEHFLGKKGIIAPAAYIPFCYYSRSEPVKPTPLPQIGFLGSLNWQPNIEGLKHFLKTIWPPFHEACPEIEFIIAGRGDHSALSRFNTKGVRIIGEVENAQKFMTECMLLNVPLYASGGVRIKIIEAASLGVPVITTPEGIKGLSMPEGGVAVCKTDEEYLKELKRLANSETLRTQRAETAKEQIRKEHNPISVIQRFEHFVERL